MIYRQISVILSSAQAEQPWRLRVGEWSTLVYIWIFQCGLDILKTKWSSGMFSNLSETQYIKIKYSISFNWNK